MTLLAAEGTKASYTINTLDIVGLEKY